MKNQFSASITDSQTSVSSPLQKVKADFNAFIVASNKSPRLQSFISLAVLDPGFQLTLSIRSQEALGLVPIVGKLLRRILNYLTSLAFSSQIGTGSKIGGGLFLPHPWGIVIGHGVVIGENATIFQQVTLGRGNHLKSEYPRLLDNVTLYAGAKAFGAIVIGNNSIVGSNAVVVKSVPDSTIVAGVPARVIRKI